MMSRMIRERSQKQKDNDRLLSDFFKNYHAKIKEVNKKEILENVLEYRKMKAKKNVENLFHKIHRVNKIIKKRLKILSKSNKFNL